MKRTHLLSLAFFLFLGMGLQAQSVEQYKSEIASYQAEIDALAAKIADNEKKILEFPGWRFGADGILGFNLNGFSNWGGNRVDGNVLGPDGTSSIISAIGNGFAFYNTDTWFWRTTGTLTLGWSKTDNDGFGLSVPDTVEVPNPLKDYNQTSDQLIINSLGGYKITKNIAISANATYTCNTFLQDFNNPGELIVGAGATYINDPGNFTLTIHPLAYKIVFVDDEASKLENAFGCFFNANYNATIYKGIVWNSNLFGLIAYDDPGANSNAQWNNSFGVNIFNGLAVSFGHQLRWAPQETAGLDDDIQQQYLLGLGYSLTF